MFKFWPNSDSVINTSVSESQVNEVFIHDDELRLMLLSDVFLMQAIPLTHITDRAIY